MTGQGAGLDGAALDVAAVEGAKVGHIAVGRLADLDGGQGVEAAASRAMTSGAAGPALLLQEGQAAASSGRRSTRAGAARVDSYCLRCGRRMSPGRHGRRRYCSNGCRQSAYKRRRRAAARAVEGVTRGN